MAGKSKNLVGQRFGHLTVLWLRGLALPLRLRAGDAGEHKVPAAGNGNGLRLYLEKFSTGQEHCRRPYRPAVRTSDGTVARGEPPRTYVLELPVRLRQYENRIVAQLKIWKGNELRLQKSLDAPYEGRSCRPAVRTAGGAGAHEGKKQKVVGVLALPL